MKTLARLLAGTCALLALASVALAQTRVAKDQPLYDVVAVGRGPGQVVLATLALPPERLTWRFRRVPIAASSAGISEVELSASGTKALIVFSGRGAQIVDLTQPLRELSPDAVPPSQHRLPHERFPLRENGRVCWVDDLGQRDENSCAAGEAAAVDAKPLGPYNNSEITTLRALLDLQVEKQQAAGTQKSRPSDQELEKLVANLHAQSASPDLKWSFYRVEPEPELYAPILEFADGEPDYPADVNVWEDIRPPSKDASLQDYKIAYASLRDRRWSRCTTYVRTISYPGTWLFEYWFYYPFDEGKAHPHIHDSEHLFVEVDKLGGTVRNVFASDHDSFVPNNLYSTLVKGAPPVPLPLFATVELGKHAMAPDMDHDGRFVRGIDDNMHPESYAFWGLRDRSTKFHFMMEPYMGSMSVPRNRAGRFALKDAAVLFPNLDVPPEHLVCSIQPFPEDPPCPDCGVTSAHAAATYLADHPDAVHPESIYKPYVLPWREVRFGVGLFDWTENRGELSVAYAGDFRHLTGGIVPIPVRFALEYGWRPYSREIAVPAGGQERWVMSKSTMYAGVRFERLITNTQGLYFAVSDKWGDISERFVNGAFVPSAPHWQYGGVSYHAGYVLELPSAHKGNMVHHVGALIGSVPGFPVLLEWRVSFGFFRERGRHDFGARMNDRNPYQ